MEIDFDHILNKEKGKVGLVCGTGGSLKQYLGKFTTLTKNKKDKYCAISCNQWHQKTNLDIDYWVIANSVYSVAARYRDFNSKKSTLIYADSADTTPRAMASKLLTVDYIAYDERHWNGKKCATNCPTCPKVIPTRKTIHEYLKDVTKHDVVYKSCGTVGIHMIAVAVILGCNPIYVTGIDMDYSTGYVNGGSTYSRDINKYSNLFGKEVKTISDSAKRIGIEIIQLSSLAKYGGIQKGEFKEI